MQVRLNLPMALVYCTLGYLLWLLLPPLLRAAVYIRSFALRLLLLHLMCVCLCRRLAFMLVVHTAAVLTSLPVRTGFLVPQRTTTTSSKRRKGTRNDMEYDHKEASTTE